MFKKTCVVRVVLEMLQRKHFYGQTNNSVLFNCGEIFFELQIFDRSPLYKKVKRSV